MAHDTGRAPREAAATGSTPGAPAGAATRPAHGAARERALEVG